MTPAMITRRMALASPALLFARGGLTVRDTPGQALTVAHNAATLLEYRYNPSLPKPYVHPLCLAGGRPITLDSPADHVHHRGLMVAWSNVNGFDFWGEQNPGPHGVIIHQRFDQRRQGPEARFVAINHWIAGGRLLLVERRTLRIPPPLPEGVWLDWTTELSAPGEPVSLAAGEHVYNGLGIRFTRDMDGGETRNANGAATIEAANGDPAAWCLYRAPDSAAAASAGVALFDHPSNPNHPNPFFVMNKAFGYLSAAPTFRRSFPIAPRQSLRFRWGVLAFGGRPEPDVFHRRFQAWTKGARDE